MAPPDHSARGSDAPGMDGSGGMAARVCSPLDAAIALVTALPESLDRHAAIRAGYEYREVVTHMRHVARVSTSRLVREDLSAAADGMEREGSIRVLAMGRVRT